MKTIIRYLCLSFLMSSFIGIGSLALAQKAIPLTDQEKTVVKQSTSTAPATGSSAVKTLPAAKSVQKKTSTSTVTAVTPKPSTTVKKTATVPVTPAYTPPAVKSITKPSTSTSKSATTKPSTGVKKITVSPVTPLYTTPAASVPSVSGKSTVQSGIVPIAPRSGYVAPSFTSTPAAGSTGVSGQGSVIKSKGAYVTPSYTPPVATSAPTTAVGVGTAVQGQGYKAPGTYVAPSYTPPAVSLPSKTVGVGTAVQGQGQGIQRPSGSYVTPMYDPPRSGPLGSGTPTGQPGSATIAPRSGSVPLFPVSTGAGTGGQEQGTKTPGSFLTPSAAGSKGATPGSDASPAFSGSAPTPVIDNTERLRVLREKYRKTGASSGNELQDGEDFTTPTPKMTGVKELPPQRLDFQRPQSAKGEAEVEKKAIQWGSKDQKGKDGGTSSGDKGSRGDSKDGDKSGDLMGSSPIPKDPKGQTDVGKGPGGKVFGWGDGIYGVGDKGAGVPAPPAGADELDKLLETGMKGPSPGSEAGGLYGPTVPGKGPGKWADDPAGTGFGAASGSATAGGGTTGGGGTVGASASPYPGENDPNFDTHTPADITDTRASWDKDGNLIGVSINYRDGTHTILWGPKYASGGSYSPEGAGDKPSPKTPDPDMTLVLMKAPPGRHTDPRIGKVGDPPAAGSGQNSGAVQAEGVASGAGKAEAKWQFAGVKPGAFLKGPRDPDLPGSGGTGGGFRPDLRRFILPDPPEVKAISTALANIGAATTRSVTVSEVTGGVQVLATQEGKQGWTPLTAGSRLAANSVIRVDKGSGGEVGIGDQKVALSMRWSPIYSGPDHTLYQLQNKGAMPEPIPQPGTKTGAMPEPIPQPGTQKGAMPEPIPQPGTKTGAMPEPIPQPK